MSKEEVIKEIENLYRSRYKKNDSAMRFINICKDVMTEEQLRGTLEKLKGYSND